MTASQWITDPTTRKRNEGSIAVSTLDLCPLGRCYTWFGRGKTSPTLDQLVKFNKRMPVVVYERIKTSEHLHFIKRYRTKLRFIGKVNVLGILLVGLAGYWYLYGTRYGRAVYDGLMTIMAAAKLDDEKYKVSEWFQKKDRLIVYVTSLDQRPRLRRNQS